MHIRQSYSSKWSVNTGLELVAASLSTTRRLVTTTGTGYSCKGDSPTSRSNPDSSAHWGAEDKTWCLP